MRFIILERGDGKKRYVPAGIQIYPPRTADERIVGITPREDRRSSVAYDFKKCSNCKQMGVYEGT